MRGMEPYQLKTFVAIAREGSLTRAAERVFTSAPAVSAQLKALEDELGVKLFERTPRGRVRFGTVVAPVALRLGDVLVKLAERHPHVTLQLQQGLSHQTLEGVRRGDLDCAYALSDSEKIDGLAVQRLGAVDLVVTLPTSLARSHPTPSLEMLTSLPWVGTPPSCILRAHLDGLFNSIGREYRPVMTADSESALRAMVASGLGAGLLRLDQAAQAERDGELAI